MTPIVTLALVTFLLFFSFSLQRPFVPVFMEEELTASILEVGYMASALGLTGLLLAVPSGFISDRIGRRVPVALGAAIWAISLAYISVSSEPYQVILSYAAAGIGTVLFDSALSAFVGDVSPPDKLGRSYGIYNAAIQIGFAAGPAAGVILILQAGYRNTFLATAILPLLVVAILLTARSQKASDSVNTRPNPPSEPVKMYQGRMLWTGWVVTFCLSILLAGLGVLVPLYARFKGFNEVFIGFLFTVQPLTGAFGRFPFGHLIDRAKRVSSLAAMGLLVAALCTAGFALSSSWMWLALMMGLFGIGLALAFMSASVVIARGTHVANRGMAMGIASMSRYAGFMVGPWLGSLVVSSQTVLDVGYTYGFLSLAAISLGAIPFLLLIEDRHRAEIG